MKKHFLRVLTLVVFMIAGGIVLILFKTSGKYYQTFSPDRQYSVYASKYFYENFLPKMPGGSGDASGKVFLYDEVEKKVINSASIAIMWTVGDIEWDKNNAYFIGEEYPNILEPWHLPRPIKMPYTKIEESDGTRIIKEFNSFDKLHSITVDEFVSACWKSVHYEAYDEQGNISFEWQKNYSEDLKSTCDFTSYIIHYRTYENRKLVSERFEHSSCDECKIFACGKETTWDSKGNIKTQIQHDDCKLDNISKAE